LAWAPGTLQQKHRLVRGRGLRARASGKPEAEESADASPWDKAVWSAAEAVGSLRAAVVGKSGDSFASGAPLPARTREELLTRLRADYDRNYFLTGDVDVELYAEDCEFADPFASFRGRERFVRNLRNLAGGFITAFRVTMLDFGDGAGDAPTEASSLSVTSRLRVVLELALPWRPTLGWVWGVTHECEAQPDEQAGGDVWRCVVHREAWEIDPAEGVAMVFRPGRGLPKQ